MSNDPEQASRKGRPSSLPRAAPLLAAAAFLLALIPAVALSAPGEARKVAQHLARELPAEAGQMGELREPAATVQAQLGVAFAELRQVEQRSDSHYMPALLAVGRAYLAASGQDPLTGIAVNPNYSGLEPELAASATRIEAAAGEARRLSRGVVRLNRDLVRSQRRVRALERELRRRG